MVVKGTVNGNTITLDEPTNLPANSRVVLDIHAAGSAASPAKPSLLAWIETHAIDDPSLPTDLSRQHDQYLYGNSKSMSK